MNDGEKRSFRLECPAFTDLWWYVLVQWFRGNVFATVKVYQGSLTEAGKDVEIQSTIFAHSANAVPNSDEPG